MFTHAIKSDREIQQDVIKELQWHPEVDSTEVGVQVKGGVVTLTGSIDSYAKKMAAKEAVHRVVGVLDVVNDLLVELPSAKVRNDQDIARAVRHALEWDVLVPDERIHCTVSNGFVTLEGEVDRWSQFLDAERAVERLTGVRGVRNQISIRPASNVNERRIRTLIEEALSRQIEREARRIGVEVHGGKVSLKGSVNSWAEKKAVLNVVRFAPNVREVEDHLVIEPE